MATYMIVYVGEDFEEHSTRFVGKESDLMELMEKLEKKTPVGGG